MSKPTFLKVPVPLLQYCIQNHHVQPLRLYLILKMESAGTYRCDKDGMETLTTMLGYKSVKTTKANLNILIDLKWINYDSKSNLYFIKGFEAIRQRLGLTVRSGVYLIADDLKTNDQFRGFAAGSIINNLINSQRRKLRKLESIKGTSIEDRLSRKLGYYPVANNAIKIIFKCSLSQAFYLKKLAQKHYYIIVKKNFIKTQHESNGLAFIKEGYPDLAPKLTRKKGEIVVKDCDTVKGNMKFSRREKI